MQAPTVESYPFLRGKFPMVIAPVFFFYELYSAAYTQNFLENRDHYYLKKQRTLRGA